MRIRGQTIVWFILCCSDDFTEGAVVVLGRDSAIGGIGQADEVAVAVEGGKMG